MFSKSLDRDQTADGVFTRPDDFARLISISTAGSSRFGQTTRTVAEICYDEEKIERICRALSMHRQNHPCGFGDSGY